MITTYGARLFKKGKEKKKQGREHTLALSLSADHSIAWLRAIEINNEAISVPYRDRSGVTRHAHLVIARAAIDGAVILG